MGSITFSRTVSVGSSPKCWKTKPTFSRRRRVSAPSDSPAAGLPSRTRLPDVGVSIQPSRCSSVVLPAPDGPTMAANSPLAMVNETSWSACTVSAPRRYVFVRPIASAAHGAVCVSVTILFLAAAAITAPPSCSHRLTSSRGARVPRGCLNCLTSVGSVGSVGYR